MRRKIPINKIIVVLKQIDYDQGHSNLY